MRKGSLTLLLSLFIVVAVQSGLATAATLTVNDSLAGVVCNQTLSLAEAAQFAEDGSSMRNLTDGEKNQVGGASWTAFPPEPSCPNAIWRSTGGVGPNFADDIFFTNAITQINDVVFLGRNDDINGLKPNGTKVILDGTGILNRSGIRFADPSILPTGSQIRNLVIRNYQLSGISLYRADGAIFEGLEIYNNGQHGIILDNEPGAVRNNRNVRIGGDQPQQRNLIYNNGLDGIAIVALPNNDRFPNQSINILNNYIGTQDGITDNGNSRNGIYLENTFGVNIGDATGATRNVISGNNNDGIKIVGEKAVSNEIFGNFIGTSSAGGAALGNSASGVALLAGAGFTADFISSGANRIGKPGQGNVISSNNGFGIFIADNNTSNNWIYGNSIGTNVGGNSDLGNNLDGILVGGGTFDNRIGNTGTSEGNLIAFNRRGIFADGGIRNSYRRNRIFSNDELGIDLAPIGVTPNDVGDGDTGPNNLLNFPVITYVNAQNSIVYIEGTYNSAPNQSYTLEFFGNTAVDPTGHGEGRSFLGQTTVTTDGSGNASFNVEFAVNIASTGTWVTATATDANNSTSEYSLARNICSLIRLSPAGFLSAASGGSSSFTVVQSVGCGGFTPVPNASWINVTSSSAGTVNFTVAANTGVQRTGAISVNFNNGQFFTFVNFNITQLAEGCTYSLSPSSTNITASGGNTSFMVTTGGSCTRTAVSDVNWISVTGGSGGVGSGSISLSVAQNLGPPRTGTVTVGGQTFTVNQSGCSYTLSQTSVNIGAVNDNSFAFNVTPSSGTCTWTVASNDFWIAIQGSSNRVGNGTVIFTASSSQGQARAGTISVAGQTFTVNQTPACTYSFSPQNQTFPAGGGSGSTNISTQPGCSWRIVPSVGWLTITGSTAGTGNGTINYSVSSNSGNSRGTQLVVNNATFDVVQQASCSFSTSVASVSLPASGGNRSFNITNAAQCSWDVVGSPNWISITSPSSNTGNQTVTYNVGPNASGSPRSGTIQIVHLGTVVRTISIYQGSGPAPFDFDGDGKTDLSIFRPSNGQWWHLRSSDGGNRAISFGESTDKLTPADFTGDGKTDVAFWRPSTGLWYVVRSEDNSFYAFPFGRAGDIPLPADYDGDGKADAAVFRPSEATWYIARSSGGTTIQQFGLSTDTPVRGDFDGDGKSDLAIFRPSNGQWWILRSSNGSSSTYTFGSATDKLIPGDYTGDGKTDAAFWRPATGEWYVLRSENLSFYAVPFGLTSDLPVPGDYDGDGTWDTAVLRPSANTWYVNRSSAGILIVPFGAAGDQPVPAVFIP